MATPKLATIFTTVRRNTSTNSCQASIWVLILTNLLIFRITYQYNRKLGLDLDLKNSMSASDRSALGLLSHHALVPQEGKAVALPSVRVDKNEEAKNPKRSIYGGRGDKVHLGGFTDIDIYGISPAVWEYMITFFGVKTLMDVGCGRGISTAWFYLHGVDALCVEGSHDAVLKTVLPHPETQIIEHDFARGPWWPEKTYDAVWCVEFLEHVGRNYHKNYFSAFRKSALIFATHSKWGGWHHVEVHDNTWWIHKFEMYGFIYSDEWTMAVRQKAREERQQKVAPNGKLYNAQHIWMTMQVFINPAIAALPQHAHLLAGPGCFLSQSQEIIFNKKCDGVQESNPPPEFDPLVLTKKFDKKWEELVKKNIMIEPAGTKAA